MHGPPIKWNFMTDGFYVFLTFILTEPTAWSSLERPPFHGGKNPDRERSISALELLRSSRSVHLYLRILTTCWENRGYSIQHVTNVMTVDLAQAVLDTPVTDVLFTNEIPISGSTVFLT